MTFSRALYLLKEGAKVRRKAWGDRLYIQMEISKVDTEARTIYGYGYGSGPDSRIYYHFEQRELLAEDWEILRNGPPP